MQEREEDVADAAVGVECDGAPSTPPPQPPLNTPPDAGVTVDDDASAGAGWGQDAVVAGAAAASAASASAAVPGACGARLEPRPPPPPAADPAMSERRGAAAAGCGGASPSGAEVRMARYKEERRRQLASQFGAREPVAGGDAGAAAPRRYIARHRGSSDAGSASEPAGAAAAASSSSSTSSSPSPASAPGGAGPLRVRTTRASRLRAASATADAAGAVLCPAAGATPGATAGPATSPSTTLRARRSSGAGASAAGGAGSGSRLGTPAPGAATTGSSDKERSPLPPDPASAAAAAARREKDKSSKRKSNLNRSLAAEEVPAPADPSEDAAVRRRRRRLEQSAEAGAAAVAAAAQAARRAALGDGHAHATAAATAARAPRAPPGAERASPARRLSGAAAAAPRNVATTSSSSSPLSGAFLSANAASPASDGAAPSGGRVPRLHPEPTGATTTAETVAVAAAAAAMGDVEAAGRRDPKRRSPGAAAHDAGAGGGSGTAEVLSASPSRQPFSILKKKSVEEAAQPLPPPTPPPVAPPAAPISILKRKISQDEAGAPPPTPPPPVTFSPSVKDEPNSGSGGGGGFLRRQGILKKRASLDEAEVLRQRSCSPDAAGHGVDFRPILKAQQRRSSLEELVRRARSPDGPPHSILKRRSRDSHEADLDVDDRPASSPEPHGILKRKSSSGAAGAGGEGGGGSSSGGGGGASPAPHVTIAAAVIKSLAVSESELYSPENGDHVRPILKKKSSSEDNTVDSTAAETPRPILKKKPSVETEDDDRPKPILKSSRKHSHEENGRDSPTRCLRLGRGSDSTSGSDCEVRPILKNASDGLRSRDRSASPRPRLSFCGGSGDDAGGGGGGDVVLPPRSSSLSDGSCAGSPRTGSPVRRLAGSPALDGRGGSPGLVRRRLLSHSPQLPPGAAPSPPPLVGEAARRPVSVAERILSMETFLEQEAAAAAAPAPAPTGAVPKRLGSLRAHRSKERFHTQPVTQEELLASSRYNHVLSPVVQIFQKPQLNGCDHETEPLEEISGLSQRLTGISPPPRTDRVETKAETVSPAQESSSSSRRNSPDSPVVREPCGSVSARASLFARLEEEMKQAAQDAKVPKKRDGSAVSRYRARREQMSNSARFSTQPVTQEEVEEAWRQKEQNQATPDSSPEETAQGVQDEDDPSKLSLAERVKLFNQKIKDGQLPKPAEAQAAPTRRRAPRFQTMPVTTEEVETAQLISPLAASLVKPPDPKILGTLSARAAKDRMLDHGVQILSRSNSLNQKHQNSESEPRRKGILKPPRDGDGASRRSAEREADSETEAEVRGILKSGSPAPAPAPAASPSAAAHSPELESFRRLRSVLKKESSGGEAPHSILKSSVSSGGASSDSESDKEAPATAAAAAATSAAHGAYERTRSSLRGGGLDIVSILHGVEAHARRQRQAAAVAAASASGASGEEDAAAQEALKRARDGQGAATERQAALAAPRADSSDGDTSSSGGREVRRIIRNEAVARRRQAALARQAAAQSPTQQQEKQQQALAKSRSHSEVQRALAHAIGEEVLSRGLQRSSTQPMATEVDAEVGASIADRLAALQESGSSGWRKRVSRLNPERDLLANNGLSHHNNLNNNHVHAEVPSPPQRKQPSPVPPSDVGGLLSERLGRLDAASQDWRKRVGPSDAVQFSVAGRMQLTPHDRALSPARAAAAATADPVEFMSPLMARLSLEGAGDRQKKKPRPLRFRAKTAQLKEAQSTPSSPQREPLLTLKRSVSAPEGDEEGLQSEESSPKATVAIPRPDDETFTQFYSSISTEKLQDEWLEIRDVDFDKIVSQTSNLLVHKRCVKIQRRKCTSRNPIKSLQARTDLRDEYEEVKMGVADKELKRLRVEQLAKSSSLAVEALAGLASKEDFTAVTLKKAVANSSAMLPYQDLMLILVKGRRHVQTRLIEPVASSINSGDNYVLVTPTEVFNWVGRFSNVIERSRGAEVAQHILQHKDLGCTGASQVITISEEKASCSLRQQERFWKLLGSDSKTAPIKAGHPDEDELFETSMIATNMIYEVQGEELVPTEEYWGGIPRISMLDPAKILVFDFGSELYVWNGKNAPVESRRQAQRLARELWDQGYDYTECDVCPLNVSSSLGSRTIDSEDSHSVNSSNRPSWALLARVTQHMETILFREKFLDWPDFSRVIRAKGSEENERQTDASIDVKPCDVKEMLKSSKSEPDLILENTHLGRGHQFYDEEKHQHYEISTIGVTVWHIEEYESSQLPSVSFGQFHSEDSYVVRWQYSVTVTGRELGSGQPSRHSILGRDRCAYFFWQGQKASVNEQGAAALLTVELDREHGPQVRAVQGAEPPAFLRLFKGQMTVHTGHRETASRSTGKHEGSWKLFLCRGETVQEAVLVQVVCSMRHLRSRAGLILLNTNTGALYVWHGAKASQNTYKIINEAAENLKTNKPPEFGIKTGVNIMIREEHEGEESKEFLKALGGSNRHLYVSLVKNLKPTLHTPRLFHFSSVSGNFSASEILGPYRQIGETIAYPFLQSDLYNASQPALFLLDNDTELWLWQGWWPSDPEDQSLDSSIQTGSGAVRWQAERRAAMQTALDYWHLSRPSQKASTNVPAFLVWAGLEPLKFTNLFPMWTDRDDIAEINIRDGKKPGEVLEVELELARLTRSTYPPAQLLQRPLPDGVDPTRLELYLEPHHFQELLGMTKEEFMELPSWKQTNIKKEVGLF